MGDINVYFVWSDSHRGLYVCKTSLNHTPKTHITQYINFTANCKDAWTGPLLIRKPLPHRCN